MRSIETSDILLSAYLKLQGVSLDRIEKQGNRGIFCFSNVDEALVERFDMGKALVEPLAFNNTVKALTTAVRRTP